MTYVSNPIDDKADMTYNFVDGSIWTLIEANVGIMRACLLILKQPLGEWFPRLWSQQVNGIRVMRDHVIAHT
jgi:1-acylglycerone phosphate reductase